MPRSAPCAGCQKTILLGGTGSLPAGKATCRDCRRLGLGEARPSNRRFENHIGGRRWRCSVCNGTFFADRHRATCSEDCFQARLLQCLETARAAKAPVVTPTCEICGAGYRRTYGEQRTCGRRCGATLQAQNRGWDHIAVPLLAVAEVELNCCEGCGGMFFLPTRRLTCSVRCYRRAYYRTTEPPRPRVEWDQSDRTCPRCSSLFSPTSPRQTYCDAKCMKAARRLRERASGIRDHGKSHRSRARKYGGAYEVVRPRKIFERDEWVCQLCKKPIDPNAKVPQPLAATLDHIVPMSEGGDHVAENCRAAHFICNSKRGTGSKGEVIQLALI